MQLWQPEFDALVGEREAKLRADPKNNFNYEELLIKGEEYKGLQTLATFPINPKGRLKPVT